MWMCRQMPKNEIGTIFGQQEKKQSRAMISSELSETSVARKGMGEYSTVRKIQQVPESIKSQPEGRDKNL